MPSSLLVALTQFLGTEFLHVRNKEEKKNFSLSLLGYLNSLCWLGEVVGKRTGQS